MISVERMTTWELKNTFILAMIFALRMLGLFMVLPVLALYAEKMPYATPALIGLAAGIYGITQAVFQLPYGILSDRIGRKPVIIGGLSLFAAGSLIAAFSHSIWGLVIGRAIQGAGAIGSPILALVADITRTEVRTRAMAVIGISIGITFTLALLLGPLLDAYLGLFGIFSLTAVLSLGGIGLVFLIKSQITQPANTYIAPLKSVVERTDLWSLNIGIFALHALLIACFQVLPLQIEAVSGFSGKEVWRFYCPVLAISLILVAPLLRLADSKHQTWLMSSAMLILGMAAMFFVTTTQALVLNAAVIVFFVAFNFLEASLPALVARLAPQAGKGAAFGIYSCSQFLGMFCGGVLGGYVRQLWGTPAIGFLCACLAIIGWITLRGKYNGQRG